MRDEADSCEASCCGSTQPIIPYTNKDSIEENQIISGATRLYALHNNAERTAAISKRII